MESSEEDYYDYEKIGKRKASKKSKIVRKETPPYLKER